MKVIESEIIIRRKYDIRNTPSRKGIRRTKERTRAHDQVRTIWTKLVILTIEISLHFATREEKHAVFINCLFNAAQGYNRTR